MLSWGRGKVGRFESNQWKRPEMSDVRDLLRLYNAPPEVQAAFAYTGVWFLLFGGVRPIGELQQLRWRQPQPNSDADQLARLTRIPGLVWVALFGVVTVAAVGAGTGLLAVPFVEGLTP